jgi:hypothetical protein
MGRGVLVRKSKHLRMSAAPAREETPGAAFGDAFAR